MGRRKNALSPVVWAGGNPRTDQRKTFVLYDGVAKTRQKLDLHEKEQRQRDEVTYKPDGEANRLNPEQQMGLQIHVSAFIAALSRMNPNLIFEVAVKDPSKYGVYIERSGNDLKTGLPGTFKHLIAGMENGWMPEFSVMAPRMEDRPTEQGQIVTTIKHAYEQKRGWRTVLAKLYVNRLITEAQIEKEFAVTEGRSSELWQHQIHSPIAIKKETHGKGKRSRTVRNH